MRNLFLPCSPATHKHKHNMFRIQKLDLNLENREQKFAIATYFAELGPCDLATRVVYTRTYTKTEMHR